MKNQTIKPIRILIFILLVVVFLTVINYPYQQDRKRANNNYWPYLYEELPENSVDVVFMGNSHAQCTFIPKIIDDILGIHSVTLISSGGSIYQTRYEYEEVMRYQNPQVIVFESFLIYGGRSQDELRPWNYSFFDTVPFSLRKIRYVTGFFFPNAIDEYLFPFTAEHTEWKQPDTFFQRWKDEMALKETPTSLKLPEQGYVNLKVPLMPGDIEYNANAAAPACPKPDIERRIDLSLQFFDRLVADEQDFLLLHAPEYRNDFGACIDETQKEFNDRPYSITDLMQNTPLNPLYFHDDGHLTQFGAVIASLETVELLGEQLGITPDAEQLRFYQSYVFSDYVLTQEGRTVHLELIPADEEISTNLKYTWRIFENGKKVYEEAGSTSPIFDYTFDKPGKKYEIRVVISNPAGAYKLYGIFKPIIVD